MKQTNNNWEAMNVIMFLDKKTIFANIVVLNMLMSAGRFIISN